MRLPDGGGSVLPVLEPLPASWLLTGDNAAGYESAEPRFADGEHFYLYAPGDSMAPDICRGDRLLFRRCSEPLGDGPHLFIIDGDAPIIRCPRVENGTVMLLTPNRDFAPQLFTPESAGRLTTVARAVQCLRRWED